MYINQKQIIQEISKETCLQNKIVQEVLKGIETVIAKKIAENPRDKMTLELWEGFKIQRYYKQERDYSQGAVKNVKCKERVIIKPMITRWFKKKINKKIFG